MSFNGNSVTDPAEKANIFNKYFQSKSFQDDLDKPVPTLPEPTHTLSSIRLTCEEVCAVLKTLLTGKACGPDQINNSILKAVADALSSPLTDLFNFSLHTSVVPDIWKKANVSPIYKKDDKTNVENYRPRPFHKLNW